MKKIIIVSSGPETLLLSDLFEAFSKKNEIIAIYTAKKYVSRLAALNTTIKNIFFIDAISANTLLFLLLWPLLTLKNFYLIHALRNRKKVELILLTTWTEKILLTIPAKIFKISVIWLEMPGQDYQKFNFIKLWLYRFNAKFAKLTCFSNFQMQNLENLKIAKSVSKIAFGIKAQNFNRQESIFDELASKKNVIKEKKYFSIGAACDFNENQNIELLLHAIKECLVCIPHLQLIILGDGPEKKNIQWMAKKLEIENLVWFVGEQNQLKKWLENLDLYIAPIHKIYLSDLQKILLAQWNSLPVIGFDEIKLHDYINDDNGLLIGPESKELAKNIINLYNDKIFYKRLSQGAKENIFKNHQIDEMAVKILAI